MVVLSWLLCDTVIPFQEAVLNDRVENVAPSHAIDNFRNAAALLKNGAKPENGDFYGMVFQDSDVAKWLEGAAYLLPDKELEEKYSNLRNINKRVVPDFNSFKEKIFIFESGLDDMAVELTKAVIGQTVSKKLDGTEVKEGYLSMYDRESNTMGFTYFTGEDRAPYVQTARLEIYGKSKEIVDSFAVKDKKLKGFIKIDREWADNILYRYKRAKQIEKLNKLKE